MNGKFIKLEHRPVPHQRQWMAPLQVAGGTQLLKKLEVT